MDPDQEQEHQVRNLVLSVCDLRQHGDIPAARCGAQAVTIGTRMYLHGGADEKQCFGDLHLLEIEQMKWTELTTDGTPPQPRFGHSLSAHHTELVLFGGLVQGEQTLLLDSSSGGAVTPPFIEGGGWGHSGNPDNSLYTLQTETLTWQRLSCMGNAPSPRFYHGVCIANDLYVIFGGTADAGYSNKLNDLHWVDLRNMQWSSPSCGGEPPSPRFAAKMIHVPEEDELLVFGGAETETAEAGVLYSIKLGTTTWTRVETQSTPPLERSFHSFDLIGNRGFVFAGQTSTEVTDLYIFDTANQRWAKPLYEGQLNVRAHASAVLHDKLIVFGGVRDKASEGGKSKKSDEKHRISKKLFFLNVLEIKDGVSEGDFKFKLVTIGDSGVGKSCLLTRFVQDYYADFHVSTIGVDFKTVITMVKGRLVKLQLWDTAGQERFSVVTGNYYRNSDGFIFVYDCTNRASFEHVDQWLGQVQQHHECGPTTMKILVGNKADMKNELQITEAEGRAKAEAMGAYFVSTSAKTAAGVDMAFLMAAQNLVEMRRQATQQQPKSLQLNQANTRTQPAAAMGGKCCAGGGAAALGRR